VSVLEAVDVFVKAVACVGLGVAGVGAVAFVVHEALYRWTTRR
jgi:hypothetical protein